MCPFYNSLIWSDYFILINAQESRTFFCLHNGLYFILLSEYYNSYMVNSPNHSVKTELIGNLNDIPLFEQI